MLKRFFVFLLILSLTFSGIVPMMINTANADDNVQMHIYCTTKIICDTNGSVGHSYTEYNTYPITWNHPDDHWVLTIVLEDGTGFPMEVWTEEHTDHGGLRDHTVNIVIEEYDRYHWSCR